MAVTLAMHPPWYPRESGRKGHIEEVLSRSRDGPFLINRLGAEGVIDQDLAVVLLDLRRRLFDEYGGGPSAMMLIDRAATAYEDFSRVTGWVDRQHGADGRG